MMFPTQYADYMAEEQEVRDAWWHPKQGEAVIDIGCMMGNWSLPALAAGAHVIAVDPNVADLNVLRQIAWMNSWHKNLRVLNCALYDGGEYPDDMKEAMAASPYAHLQPPPGTEMRTLDSFEFPRMDWIKMDVEGAEYGILCGSVETLKKCRPRLVIEDHSIPYQWVRDNDITGKCTRLLEGLDYKVVQWPFDKMRTFLIADPS